MQTSIKSDEEVALAIRFVQNFCMKSDEWEKDNGVTSNLQL